MTQHHPTQADTQEFSETPKKSKQIDTDKAQELFSAATEYTESVDAKRRFIKFHQTTRFDSDEWTASHEEYTACSRRVNAASRHLRRMCKSFASDEPCEISTGAN